MFIKRFLLSGVPFGLFMGLVFSLRADWRIAASAGLLAGTLFGLPVAAFLGSRWLKASTRPEFGAGERILKEGPANHFLGLEGVGGWLFLTDARLVFKSHSLNFQKHELSIPFAHIVEARPVSTAGLIPNGLEVTIEGGRSERFVVEGRKEWGQQIMSVCRGRSTKA